MVAEHPFSRLTPLATEVLAHTVGKGMQDLDRTELRQQLKQLQEDDPAIRPYLLQLGAVEPIEGEVRTRRRKMDLEYYSLRQGVLYRVVGHKDLPEPVNALVLPQGLKATVLVAGHDDPLTGGHLSAPKVYGKLRTRYWWPAMMSEIKVYCRQCEVCATAKGRVGYAPHANIPLPVRPFQMVGIDPMGPFSAD